jgi:hypothetical protein
MVARLILLALLWLPLAPRVYAAACPQPYSGAQLLNDIQVIQFALRSLDEASFAVAAGRMDTGIACLNSPVQPQVFATAYRYMGMWYYFKQDNNIARRWIRSSLELDPTFEFSAQELEAGHPLRAIWDEERAALNVEEVPIEGQVLNLPAGSRLTIDGRALDAPAATLDRYHIIQQIGMDNSVRATWLIAGNDLPPGLLRDSSMVGPVVEEPQETGRKKKEEPVAVEGEVGVPAQTRVERVRPPEKTPLMIGGVVALLGAGAMYGGAIAAERQFHPAEGDYPFATEGELDSAQALVNGLIMGAGGLVAVGVGVGYWGIVIDDGGAGLTFTRKF